MNNVTIAVILGAICGILLGMLVGASKMADTIEKDCLYKQRLVFSTDKVFECNYLEGVKVK